MPLTSPRFALDPRLQNAAENNPPMRFGERGDSVATVQRSLVDLGYFMPITTKGGRSWPDGIFGAETKRVVGQFQMDNGLDSDGVVGRHTMARLDQLIDAKMTAELAKMMMALTLPPRLGFRTMNADS